jgi:hypothetical protein
MLPVLAATPTAHHKSVVAFIILGLFFLSGAFGFWASGKLRARANLTPTYFGLAAYWWVFLALGTTCLVAGGIVAAV